MTNFSTPARHYRRVGIRPSFDGEHIGVAVDKSVVSLSGHVSSYAEKVGAIAAVQRVKGVHAIAENIEVRYPFQKRPQTISLPSAPPIF